MADPALYVFKPHERPIVVLRGEPSPSLQLMERMKAQAQQDGSTGV
jgi:hypothetical protein